MRALILVGILLSMALAGCLGGDGDDLDGNNGSNGSGRDGPTGAIAGQVAKVDALEPISGATLTLVQDGNAIEEGQTQGDGTYHIQNVPVGVYMLQVSAPCCHGDVSTIRITEGNTTQASFQLEPYAPIEVQTPYVDGPHDWRGFIECWVRVAGTSVPTPCSGTANHDRRHSIEIQPGLRTITMGMHWEAPGIGDSELELELINTLGGDHTYIQEVGTSPLEIRLDNEDIEDEERQFLEFENPWNLRVDVTPGENSLVTYQQQFTVYYTLHYWDPAPSGYSPMPDL